MGLKVGDNLYYISSRKGIQEVVITKVGRKYVYVGRTTIDIETLNYTDKLYSQHNKQFYLTVDEAGRYIERTELVSTLQNSLTYFKFNTLSLEDLKVINVIMDKYK